MSNTTDITIVGGGIAGLSQALAIASLGFDITIIEAREPVAFTEPGFDARCIALSQTSKKIFSAIGLWQDLQPYTQPIKHIHVSEKGKFGTTWLHAEDEKLTGLGYVIEMPYLQMVLQTAVAARKNIHFLSQTTVSQFDNETGNITYQHKDKVKHLTTKLLIAADGEHSSLRSLMQIATHTEDYQQHAIVTTVTTDKPMDGTTYERFLNTGPLAFLPVIGDRYAVVWTVPSNDANRIKQMDDETFKSQLQSFIGNRIGTLQKIGKRQAFPLKLLTSNSLTLPKFALIGNAAHCLHPVAALSFNLSLRDIAALSQFIKEYGLDNPKTLTVYEDNRRAEQKLIIRFSDFLVKAFTSRLPLISHLRGPILTLLDISPFKHHLLKQLLGNYHQPTDLAMGIPL